MLAAPVIRSVLFGLRDCLLQVIDQQPRPAPGALATLASLRDAQIPCIWLDQLPDAEGKHLAKVLPAWLPGYAHKGTPWPAPDPCWQALMAMQAEQLEGCVLVSGEPKLLQAGLNAGVWTVGLAACEPVGESSALQWQGMTVQQRDIARGKATLALFNLGVHSVIDHLAELDTCLADIALRCSKGEKP